MPNPFSSVAGFAAPGGKINWLRIAMMFLGFAIFALLLFYIAKPILNFFGIGPETGGSKDPKVIDLTKNGLNESPPVPHDSPANNAPTAGTGSSTTEDNYDYLISYVDDLVYVIAKTYWMLGYGAGSERCVTFQRCYNDLDDNELARVVNAYKKRTGKSLKSAIQDLTFGCDNNFVDVNYERFDQMLIKRIDEIYSGREI